MELKLCNKLIKMQIVFKFFTMLYTVQNFDPLGE